MAHEMSVNAQGNVEAVFGYGEIPWWNDATLVATVLPGAVGFDEIFSIAFPWTADMERLQYSDGSLSASAGIRRSDTKRELGVHSAGYGNIQPRSLFEFCAGFFATYPEVPIASAIAMRGGKVLNISARTGEFDILGSGDVHRTYLCFVNSFDGSMKAQVYKSYVQPVCMNTTRAGLSSADFKMTYRHTKNVEKRISADSKRAYELMEGSQATDAYVQHVLEELAKKRPSRAAYEDILTALFGDSESTKTKNKKAEVTSLVASGVNAQAFPDFKGTGYGIYTALTDYADHQRSVRVTQGREDMSPSHIRFEEALVGNGAEFKQEALSVLERVLLQSDGSEVIEPVYTSLPASRPPVNPDASLLDQILTLS